MINSEPRKGWHIVAVRIGILLLVAFATIRADTVELKTGEKIEGKFKQATQAGVVIEVGGQAVTFGIEKVRAIYFGSAPVSQQVPSQIGQALDALKALNSVTSAGVTFREYSTRVLDAKVVVDRFLASAPQDPAHDAISSAMGYHEMASQAWSTTFRRPLSGGPDTFLEVGTKLQHDSCPEAVKLVERAATNHAGPGDLGLFVGQHPGPLWQCAARKVAEAESITAKTKK
jgi:hypothetical protein